MCEVQELGAPEIGSHRGASPPPGRLSISSSGTEEDLKTPRDSLLSHCDEGLKGESGDIEASELYLAISRKIKDEEKEKMEEEELEREKVETMEKEEGDENAKEESESEAINVKDSVCDESERENQENERRDEMVENAPKTEREIKDEKIVDDSVEAAENARGNDEAASNSDSPKAEEPRKQGVEEEGKQNNEQEEKDNKDKHEDDEQKNKEREGKTEEEEGVDSSSPKEKKDAPLARRVSKTVNFLDSELKKYIENNPSKRNTINSTTSSSFKSEEEEEDDEEERDVKEDRIGGGELEEKNGRQWALGEGNPVYRLSLKLSPNLFNTTDIPGPNQHKEAEKTGFLTKLSGRSFPYIAQWKRRYCVLSKGRLYYYEREDSKAGDKTNGVIQLEYFDQVAEAGPKECKKATNVFVITSQDRSFFDPGRHLFSADTLPDMKDWIRRLQAALDQIRNNNRPAAATSPSASPSTKDGGGGGKRRRDEAVESKDSKESQTQIISNKERKKKKEESGRTRKSSRVGVSNQTQTSMVEPMTCEVDGGRPVMAVPKGGVILPGFSSRKDPPATNRSVQHREDEDEAEDDLPRAGPTLPCVTKQRVKGPQGRRAPQNHRRTAAAAALKKRASSLSALEHQDVNDNRSESSEGATRSYRDSQTTKVDLKEEMESEEENERKKLKKEILEEEEEEEEVQDNSPERQFKIDNIDDGLFFKPGLKDGAGLGSGSDRESQRKRRTLGLKVNFEENSTPASKNGTLSRLLRLRDTVGSTKRKKYETNEALVADHPDMVTNSRWRCVIL